MVELLLALALSALLTAALSAMIGQAARDRRAMAEQPGEPAWAVCALRQIERDLQQARWWAGAGDQVVLLGLGRDGRPAQIAYRWRTRDDHTTLVREERPLTESTARARAPRAELIAVDPAGLAVGPHRFGSAVNDDDRLDERAAPDRRTPANASPSAAGATSIQIDGVTVPLRSLPDQVGLAVITGGAHPQTLTRKAVLR